jgi:phospholipid/cholesterol/gamma-HCH transport system permease protein
MGVNTRAYLIAPKVIASLVVIPMLIIIAVFLGVIGGWAGGVMGGFFSTSEYVKGLTDNMKNWDIVVMMIKAVLFSIILSTIPSYKGYTVSGGALEIGKASTQAVVYSSICVIIVNFFVAFFLLG